MTEDSTSLQADLQVYMSEDTFSQDFPIYYHDNDLVTEILKCLNLTLKILFHYTANLLWSQYIRYIKAVSSVDHLV